MKEADTNENRACIVAGCRIPARGPALRAVVDGFGFSFPACGNHRKIVAELMNRTVSAPLLKARTRAVANLIDGLYDLGDHTAEAKLALATKD